MGVLGIDMRFIPTYIGEDLTTGAYISSLRIARYTAAYFYISSPSNLFYSTLFNTLAQDREFHSIPHLRSYI